MLNLSKFFEIDEGVEFRITDQENLIFKIQDNVLMCASTHLTLLKWQEWNLGINELVHCKIEILPQQNQILTDAEREYLKAVIKPFKNRVVSIRKGTCFGDEYISIELNCEGSVDLPFFKKDEHYKGMEIDMCYTLEKLGL